MHYPELQKVSVCACVRACARKDKGSERQTATRRGVENVRKINGKKKPKYRGWLNGVHVRAELRGTLVCA